MANYYIAHLAIQMMELSNNENLDDNLNPKLLNYINYLEDPINPLNRKIYLLGQFCNDTLSPIKDIKNFYAFEISIRKIKLHKSGSIQKNVKKDIHNATKWLKINHKAISIRTRLDQFTKIEDLEEGQEDKQIRRTKRALKVVLQNAPSTTHHTNTFNEGCSQTELLPSLTEYDNLKFQH